MINGDKNSSRSVWGQAPTWYTGDAKDVGVAHKEALQDVSGLVGVNDDNFGGGLGAGTDPNQRRHFIMLSQFLLSILLKKKKKKKEVSVERFFFFPHTRSSRDGKEVTN